MVCNETLYSIEIRLLQLIQFKLYHPSHRLGVRVGLVTPIATIQNTNLRPIERNFRANQGDYSMKAAINQCLRRLRTQSG